MVAQEIVLVCLESTTGLAIMHYISDTRSLSTEKVV